MYKLYKDTCELQEIEEFALRHSGFMSISDMLPLGTNPPITILSHVEQLHLSDSGTLRHVRVSDLSGSGKTLQSSSDTGYPEHTQRLRDLQQTNRQE